MNSSNKKPKSSIGPSTKAIHHGKNYAEATGTVMPPIFPSVTFSHGNKEGFDYTRSGNPNFRILESVLSSIEDCRFSTAFGSGVSAITAIVSSLKAGDVILCEENLYGCTVRLFEQVFKKFGLTTKWLDFTKPSVISEISELNPTMIWIESPTNPMLKVIDIESICKLASSKDIPVVVDNTFATPLLQSPLKLGAKLSLTSTTKYINGHSDALGGSVCTNDEEWHERMRFAQKSMGLQPSPFDCWLITRGIKTLPLRLEQQIKNASSIADHLAKYKSVNWVRYPFRKDHPNNIIAKKQMNAGGAIVTALFNCTKEETYSFCKSLKYFTMAESLGGVESLVCHPASMTHAAVDLSIKNKLGISEGLVRFSLGCENTQDLIEDLSTSLLRLNNHEKSS